MKKITGRSLTAILVLTLSSGWTAPAGQGAEEPGLKSGEVMAIMQTAALKAWSGLSGLVSADGKLTHVQPVGADPKNFDPDLSQTYGVGSILLAGSEIYRMTLMKERTHAALRITSSLDTARPQETIQVDWTILRRKLPGVTAENVAVMDGVAGRWLPSLALDSNRDGKPDQLAFQADFLPGQRNTFTVFSGVDRTKLPAAPSPMAHADVTRPQSQLKIEWR
jgi:hypothetical protein